MKKRSLFVAGLLVFMRQQGLLAQSETSPSVSSIEAERNWVRSESELNEAALANTAFDAFLSESGYVVYPVEENCAVLQAKFSKNPMILHKEFIPRRVRILRRVDGRSSDGAVKGMLGKQFMIVSEIGSVSEFMVDLKDLHFVQNRDDALDNPK